MARGKKKEAALSPTERLQAALVPESEQPYKVPENWCWIRLGDLYQINPKNYAEDFVDAAFIPMEKIAPGFVNEYSFDVQPWCKAKKGHTQFADGDVAFAKISPCFENRKSMFLYNLPNGIGGGTTELVILRQSHINQKYTFWLISQECFIRGGVATYSGTVGQQRISMDYVRTYPIPIPPLPEQQRIVDRIESLFVKLDEAKQKAQDALDSFETRKAAILHKAFTGELTAQWREEHGVRMESWKRKTIDNVFFVFSGKGFKEKEYSQSGIKLLRISNVTYDSLIWDDTKYLPNEYKEIVPELLLNPTDIVLALNRPITNGKLKISVMNNAEPVILYQRVACLRMRDAHCVDYLRFALESREFLYQIQNNLQGSDQPYINLPPLKKLTLPICSLEEQAEIVRILDDLLAKEQQAKEAAEKVLEQIDLTKKAILARAFRGELGTNDPNEESAVELLKETLQKTERFCSVYVLDNPSSATYNGCMR